MSEQEQETKVETKTQTDAELLNKIAMLEGRIDVREKQLKQALDWKNRRDDEDNARELKEKVKLIDSIQQDSHFSKDELKDTTISELQTMRKTLDKSIEKTFVSVSAELDEQKRKSAPHLTAGAWDNTEKKWVGGL